MIGPGLQDIRIWLHCDRVKGFRSNEGGQNSRATMVIAAPCNARRIDVHRCSGENSGQYYLGHMHRSMDTLTVSLR